MKSIAYISLALLLLCGGELQAQFSLYAISSDPGPGLFVALTWPDEPGVTHFNLYRKPAGPGSFPATPVNATPVGVPGSCAEIQALLGGMGSPDWELLSNALADSSGLFDPCQLATLTPGTNRYEALLMLARGNLNIARVAGLGFVDNSVVNGTAYQYRIASVSPGGTIISNLAVVTITAGNVVLPPAPAGLLAESGDAEVWLRWQEANHAMGYEVSRAIVPGGPYQQVNAGLFISLLTNDLDGDTLVPNLPGFVDFQHYDGSGAPASHTVNGATISGPTNGLTYYYRVRSVDLLQRTGPWSAVVSATPQDETAPAAPTGITVTPDENSSSILVRWEKVVLDVKGHQEVPGVNHYKLFRYENASDPSVGGVLVAAGIAAPPAAVVAVEFNDVGPGLRQDFGDKTWWYRLQAQDVNGNVGPYSAAISGTLADTTRPNIVKGLIADGFDDHIALLWDLNGEPDLDGYMIYRSLCHYGSWVPCDSGRYRDPKQDYPTTHLPNYDRAGKPIGQLPCSGPFVYLGEISRDSAEKARSLGNYMFRDLTVPAGSPLCYAYWIKAKDHSGNRSGGWPMPWVIEQMEIVCERLRDKTPPEPAFISGLYARDNAILIEWIGPPTQDIRAYHVYRAKQEDPTNYVWVGGMTVEKPPVAPLVLASPYTPPATTDCGVIPVVTNETMSAGSFLDKGVDPHQIYLYKVVGVDFNGNESPLDAAVEISTFTFKTEQVPAPTIVTLSPQEDPCALVIAWAPAYNASQHVGFAVFKSREQFGSYTQVADLVEGNVYLDPQIVKGLTYWYKVVRLDQDGSISQLSVAQSGSVSP